MALHKIIVEDFIDEIYSLIAIHCGLEDYHMAYLLNKHLSINLERKPEDLDFKYVESSYSIFEWKDHTQFRTWNLVSNICKKEEEILVSSGSLFDNSTKVIRTHNLMPEHKTVNYMLKITNEGNAINERTIINKIQEIAQVITAYNIDVSKLKYRDHLIFN